jgi:hypothetical protein
VRDAVSDKSSISKCIKGPDDSTSKPEQCGANENGDGVKAGELADDIKANIHR